MKVLGSVAWGLGLLLAACLTSLESVAGEATLVLELASPSVIWGRTLRARLVYEGPRDPGRANLDAWAEDFEVERRFTESAREEDGGIVLSESLYLYPRRLGTLKLLPVALGGAVTDLATVEVEPASIQGTDLTPAVSLSSRRAWVGEQLRLEVRFKAPESLVEPLADPPEAPGFDVVALPVEMRETGGIAEYRLAWALVPLRHGDTAIVAPALRLRFKGKGMWTFFLPAQSLRIDPLPAYLPPTVPVGSLKLDGGLVMRGARPFWEIRVETDGRLPAGLPGLQDQLSGLTGVPADRVDVSAVTRTEADGLVDVLVYRVELPHWLTPLRGDPEITVSRFDPLTSRLQSVTQTLPAVWRYPGWVVPTLIAAVAASLLWPGWLGVRALHRLRRTRAWLARLQSIDDPRSLRGELLRAQGCRCLGDWSRTHPDREAAGRYARRLDAACFGRGASGPGDSLVSPEIWRPVAPR